MRNRDSYRSAGSARAILGMFLLGIGSIMLLDRFGIDQIFPRWVFSWPMILIIIGVFTGIRHDFKNTGSFVLITIGTIFLLDKMDLGIHMSNFIWPGILIAFGIRMIMGQGYRTKYFKDNLEWDKRQSDNPDEPIEPLDSPTEEYMNSSSIFGGVKKNIVSKNFRGGDIVNFMGGAQINLSQADINGRVVLDITQVFGGTKIIVPAHWQVDHQMISIFGGVEDKRQMQPDTINSDKVLIIKGISIFGGVDIKNF
jgi:predicted membrane protein